METVWKYRLQYGYTMIEVPRGHVVRSVGTQFNRLTAWIEVAPGNTCGMVVFAAVPTGGRVPDDEHKYIGTVQDHNDLTWHIYEILDEAHDARPL